MNLLVKVQESWKTLKGDKYKIHRTGPRNYSSMVQYCEERGMTLPLPRNLLENIFLKNQIANEKDLIYLNAERKGRMIWLRF